jgi:para-aminobenzoate synthetase/4-amino-4-deoxychorismate lyase
MGDRAVASLSPELFLRRSGRRVLTSPIKGTIRRDESDATAADAARTALEASGKDRAENVMIVDLMRNDLSRVCAAGTVQVPEVARAEAHPGVWHLVSDVEGTLSDGVDDGEVLRACFPPGSVTGAPKVRAMELINELEATGREAYTGAIGFSSPLAGLEMNVVIRTFEFGHDRVWLGVGGGIVADSDPESEYRECLVKAEPLVAALDAEIVAGTALADRKALVAREAEAVGVLAAPVFETMLVVDGVAIDLHAHLARLGASGVRTDRFAGLSQRVQRTARALSTGRHRLRIDVAPRGGGRSTTVAASSSGEVTVESKVMAGRAEVRVTTELSATPSESADQPTRLRPVDIPGGHGRHKVAIRDRLASIDGDEPLVVDGEEVLETGWGNLFAVSGRTIRTPPTDGRILPGTVRAWVLRAAPSLGLGVEEGPVTRSDLAAADEVFVTSAIRGVQPVDSCIGIGSWPTGPVTGRLAEGRASHVQRTVARHRGWVDRARDPWPPRGPLGPGRLVVVDNYDSFTFNLVHHLGELGADPVIVRNDEVTAAEVIAARPRGIVLSPGPAGPDDAGICVELIETIDPTTPLLGVCLGHQCMGAAFGAAVVRAPEVIHGKVSEVHHDGQGVFRGLPDPMVATRYHSLMVDEATLPDALLVTARTDDGLIMGLRHASRPLYGVQFHPESVLTEQGRRLLANFLGATGSC